MATVTLSATARISSLGIAFGHTAGILLLLITVLPVQRAWRFTNALPFAIGSSGAWGHCFHTRSSALAGREGI
jgi:UMF1 family MFS transporter